MHFSRNLLGLAICLFALSARADPTTSPSADSVPVQISVDLSKPIAAFKPIYRYFGCDEPNYAYSPAGKRLLGELGKLGTPDSPVYFRTHNLFTSGDGTPALKWGSTNVYTEDADGKPVYDFTILDRIFDAYHDAGVKPYFQLGFMPEAMSTHPEPYRHHWDPSQKYDAIITGWAYPPKDWKKWEDLCYEVTKHCVERYGKDDVATWYFETWNEANGSYWRGTRDEFWKLHDCAVAGVRRALPNARVGGPDSAGDGGDFTQGFLDHCLDGTNAVTGDKGTPLDFLSFHAKGSPMVVDGHVRMGIAAQLKALDKGFARFAKDPRTKGLPIVIGESDPEGCAACQGPSNAYRNGTMYSSYTAAVFARHLELADKYGVNLQGMLTWAFLFDDQPMFAGFRVLASGQVDHPVLNVFRMLAKMSGQRVAVQSSSQVPLTDIVADGVRGTTDDVSAIATVDGTHIALLVWNYHDDDLPGPDASVNIALSKIPTDGASAHVTEYRIDQTHSNAFTAWKEMGSPATPTAEQIASLQTAAALQQIAAYDVKIDRGTPGVTTSVHLDLPRQGVSLVTVEVTPR